MKKFLVDFITRLTSRKFLLTLSAGILLVAEQKYDQLILLISAYLAVEGGGDAAARYGAAKAKVEEIKLEDTKVKFEALEDPDLIDKTTLLPGLSADDIPM